MMNSICINQVTKAFREKEVLKNITLEVSMGEIFGLLGPSGAGKTTLIRILTGQLSYQGSAEILGKSCDKLDRSIYSDIGMMTDNSGIYERLTCYDNLILFAHFNNVKKEQVTKVLERVGLTDKKANAGKLSKGMKQRLILARALLHHPRLLFLDEPTSGLDPATAEEIHKLLLDLKAEGTTIFLTTHNMVEAQKLCDHIALLNEGTIVEYGVPDEICRKFNQDNIISVLCRDGRLITLRNQPEYAAQIAELFTRDEVEAIHSSEPDLETVFMKLTGKELNV
ncbi:MAG: transporter related [Herbinix sp.]|jgi:ABC-2 type transport system ATP-binding protein|nr:transporter related [Herbinix sp.]